MNFKLWLLETWLHDLKNEAIARFSTQHKDKDVNQIPPGMWQWTLDKMSTSTWVPKIEDDNGSIMGREQVFALVQDRAEGKTWQSGQQAVNQHPTKTINEKEWVLAKVINVRGLETNEHVVLSKRDNDMWDLRTASGSTRALSQKDIQKAVQSVKNEDGKPITSTNPDELFALVQSESNDGASSSGRIDPNKISKYQQQIEQKFSQSRDNIIVSALAGTGKTTMLKHLASYKKPNEKWLYLVFGKKNEVEAKQDQVTGKFPSQNMDIYTSHAFLGKVLENSALRQVIPKTRLKFGGGKKIGRILDNMLENDGTFPQKFKYSAKSKIQKLASLGKAFAINPVDESQARETLNWIVEKYAVDMDLSTDKHRSDRDYTDDILDKTIDLLRRSLPGNSGDAKLNMERDHDDTLWYSHMNNDIQWPRYDVVLADEVQDFNRCQMLMLEKLKAQGARVIAVGDRNQSIFMFRGADANAFDNVLNMLGTDVNELPVNYRSCRAIIEYVNQNTHVNNLQAGLDCEGEVVDNIDYESAMGVIESEWSSGNKLAKQTAIIARTNTPLVKTAMRLLQHGIDFVFMGRDLSKELVDMIGRIIGKGKFANHTDIGTFSDTMHSWLGNLQTQWEGKISKAAELKELEDTAEAIEGVIEYLASNGYADQQMGVQVTDTSTFIQYLQSRFGGLDSDSFDDANQIKSKDPKGFVTLTTAHKSKGLEYERVIVIRNDLFPHPSAKTDEEKGQEDNAKYVAYTRAREQLYVCSDNAP